MVYSSRVRICISPLPPITLVLFVSIMSSRTIASTGSSTGASSRIVMISSPTYLGAVMIEEMLETTISTRTSGSAFAAITLVLLSSITTPRTGSRTGSATGASSITMLRTGSRTGSVTSASSIMVIISSPTYSGALMIEEMLETTISTAGAGSS